MSSEAVFLRLYEAYYEEVHAFCMRRVGRADADDVASEVFTAAWRRIDDVQIGAERSWLFGIARNLIRNEWRSNARRNRLVGRIRQGRRHGPDQPDELAVRRSEGDLVVRALDELRDSDREILIMSAWDSLSGLEIARILGISANSVHQRLYRAKKRLARAIGGIADQGTVDALGKGAER